LGIRALVKGRTIGGKRIDLSSQDGTEGEESHKVPGDGRKGEIKDAPHQSEIQVSSKKEKKWRRKWEEMTHFCLKAVKTKSRGGLRMDQNSELGTKVKRKSLLLTSVSGREKVGGQAGAPTHVERKNQTSKKKGWVNGKQRGRKDNGDDERIAAWCGKQLKKN